MDWIVLTIVLILIGCAVGYIIKSKKQGVKCIGCPAASSCHSGKELKEQASCCGCQHKDSSK
ncbi:MAG: FeoB-associated Cys-rich membrane protein [Butyricicoccus pullicaecorum]|nr:FeoB-associated Cys-rich membrane protein [Butyricicoccus pullicaecorum]MDO4668360.1 FeoB-associated Cys-rich membrane protein [Butyricicoccus pullicaecorum]